jgi:hypothetical protein
MNLSKFVNSNTGRHIMSIILGIGLATLFRTMCSGKNCNIIKAPPLEEIDDKIYKFDNKCYKLEKSAVKCDNKKQIINFA